VLPFGLCGSTSTSLCSILVVNVVGVSRGVSMSSFSSLLPGLSGVFVADISISSSSARRLVKPRLTEGRSATAHVRATDGPSPRMAEKEVVVSNPETVGSKPRVLICDLPPFLVSVYVAAPDQVLPVSGHD